MVGEEHKMSDLVSRLSGRIGAVRDRVMKPDAESGVAGEPRLTGLSNTGKSIVAAGLSISGNLESRGDIEIYGHVAGDVIGRDIIIAADATVEGSVIADSIEVFGAVIGPITAIDVELRSGARVIGKITHNTMNVESGVVTEGLQPWQPVQFFTG